MYTGKPKSSQLIITNDGTLYHINLKRADPVPRNLLLVGSAERVDVIARQFDAVTFRSVNKSRPEFYFASGKYHGVPIGAFSTGIGVDNMEIVLNELHALFEYDHARDRWAKKKPRVCIIRVGTAGTSLPNVPSGMIAISQYAIGLDNLGAYYPAPRVRDKIAAAIERKFLRTAIGKVNPLSYCAAATPRVARVLAETAYRLGETRKTAVSGITTASPGFFGPEGRQVGRLKTALTIPQFLNAIQNFDTWGCRIVNHEMETSALFRLGWEQLGYNVGAICLVLDNLATNDVLHGAKAARRMDATIRVALEAMVVIARRA